MTSLQKNSTLFLHACTLMFLALFPLTKIAGFDLFFHLRLAGGGKSFNDLVRPGVQSFNAHGPVDRTRAAVLKNDIEFMVALIDLAPGPNPVFHAG